MRRLSPTFSEDFTEYQLQSSLATLKCICYSDRPTMELLNMIITNSWVFLREMRRFEVKALDDGAVALLSYRKGNLPTFRFSHDLHFFGGYFYWRNSLRFFTGLDVIEFY